MNTISVSQPVSIKALLKINPEFVLNSRFLVFADPLVQLGLQVAKIVEV